MTGLTKANGWTSRGGGKEVGKARKGTSARSRSRLGLWTRQPSPSVTAHAYATAFSFRLSSLALAFGNHASRAHILNPKKKQNHGRERPLDDQGTMMSDLEMINKRLVSTPQSTGVVQLGMMHRSLVDLQGV